MKRITVKDLRTMDGAEIVNADVLAERKPGSVSTDSRTADEESIFVALRGERFDGHAFIGDVVRRGIRVLVVEKEWMARRPDPEILQACTVAVVPDTTKALGELARTYRKKFDIPVIAVAGSNGKTTTKEMITAVLSASMTVMSTQGNLNNHIGVPQTLFRLAPEHDAAVVEVGTNHFGELGYLCDIAEPTHGTVTTIGKEHLEFFGDEAGVAKEETELFRYLNETGGFAFVNADDPYLSDHERIGTNALRYGTSMTADVRASKIVLDAMGRASFDCLWRSKERSFRIALSTPGMHTVVNALCAASIGLHFGVKESAIAETLGRWTSASKRMEVVSHNGITLLNDTYNSNPDSALAALRTLQAVTAAGRKIAVLGDMKELGDASKREHTNIGAVAAEMGLAALFTFGPFSKYTCEAFGADAEHFESKEELSRRLAGFLREGDAVLVKGSRGMRMEEVVSALMGQAAAKGN
jgi:UDP-N-acetylmuramoyl-tripeptide--D-alanyl-D-alanine ligase